MKVYLGDAVYVDNNGNTLILTVEDGVRVTNKIYLEPEVYHALVNYVVNKINETLRK